jgi:hypothetical protein
MKTLDLQAAATLLMMHPSTVLAKAIGKKLIGD